MFYGECDSKWLHQGNNRAIVALTILEGNEMEDCLHCLGTKQILVPTRDGTDFALCPNCFKDLPRGQHPSLTVQHPSGMMIIKQTKGEK